MTERDIIPANDNQASRSIAKERVSANGGVFSIILGLGAYPLKAMGIVSEQQFNPEQLYKAVNNERRRVIAALEQDRALEEGDDFSSSPTNDNNLPLDQEKEKAA